MDPVAPGHIYFIDMSKVFNPYRRRQGAFSINGSHRIVLNYKY